MASRQGDESELELDDDFENWDWNELLEDVDQLEIIADRPSDFSRMPHIKLDAYINKHFPLALKDLKGFKKSRKIDGIMAAIAANNAMVEEFLKNNENKENNSGSDDEDEEDDDEDRDENVNVENEMKDDGIDFNENDDNLIEDEMKNDVLDDDFDNENGGVGSTPRRSPRKEKKPKGKEKVRIGKKGKSNGKKSSSSKKGKGVGGRSRKNGKKGGGGSKRELDDDSVSHYSPSAHSEEMNDNGGGDRPGRAPRAKKGKERSNRGNMNSRSKNKNKDNVRSKKKDKVNDKVKGKKKGGSRSRKR